MTDDLKIANEKLKHKESIHLDLKEKLVMEQNKRAKLETEYSELKSELCEVKRQYKEKTEELETYTEQTQNKIDEDLEYHVLVENHLRRETNVLRNEIEVLKMNCLSIQQTLLRLNIFMELLVIPLKLKSVYIKE